MSDRYGSSNRRWFVHHRLEPLRETLAEAGWQVVDATVQQLSQVLDRHCDAVGRDPATIRRAVQFRLPDSADDALRVVELHARAGFTDLILMRYGAAESAAAAAEAIAALLPKLRSVG